MNYCSKRDGIKQAMRNKTKHNGFVLWIMGPTSSGKTTLATHLLRKLRDRGLSVLHYDGDEVRSFFGPDFGFSGKNRLRVVKTIVHLANKALVAGNCVIVSALTANPDARELVFRDVANLVIAHVNCSIEKCMHRDPKGLYRDAAKGKIDTLIGFNTRYAAPQDAEIVINTEKESVAESVHKLDLALGKELKNELR